MFLILSVLCLELLAEVGEELYPELPVVHVVQAHLPLDLGADHVPAGVSVAPRAPPLVLVSPGVPHPDQTHPVPPGGPRPAQAHPVEPRDGVGVALHQPVLVSVAGVAPVSLPRARDESLVSHIFINNQSGLQ